ncbi:MAG TPA: hypothetical protein VFO89_15245, partial [Thermoanaerobaculia bacterium]|nr:hypothetical protein [Thermoanaerobaculia bacterium]
MRDHLAPSRDEPSAADETIRREYDFLLAESVRIAQDLTSAAPTKKPSLSRTLNQHFADRVALLRRLPTFVTLDDHMPELQAIADRERTRHAARTAGQIDDAFTFDRTRPADVQLAEATDAHARLVVGVLHAPVLRDADAATFQNARRAVLEAIGCTFPFAAPRAAYTNMLSFVKHDFVIRLTHDALPAAKGLPNAGRIAAMAILPYVNGEARGH